MELSLDLRVVHYSYLKEIILQNFHLSEVQLLRSDHYLRPIGIRANVEQVRLVVVGAYDVDV